MRTLFLVTAMGTLLLLGGCWYHGEHHSAHDSRYYGDFASQRMGPRRGSAFLSHW